MSDNVYLLVQCNRYDGSIARVVLFRRITRKTAFGEIATTHNGEDRYRPPVRYHWHEVWHTNDWERFNVNTALTQSSITRNASDCT